MVAILSLLVVLTLSLLVTRVATIALTHTGLARESARFQARSAFTGVGFTTIESENVVQHPVRRRIVLFLMLLGNAGFVAAVSSLILSFVGQERDAGEFWWKIAFLAVGVGLLWMVAQSEWVDRHLCRWIDWALKRYTRMDVRDYASLMHLAGDYRIVELSVRPDDWLAGKTLAQTQLRAEGVDVLGIQRRDGLYLGAPMSATEILPEDTLLLYGRISALERLDERRADPGGDREHREAVAEERAVRREEAQEDAARTTDAESTS